MRRSARRRGVVLILVLVVVMLLSLAAYAFTELMLTEHEATQLSGQQVQAGKLAESGVEFIRVFLLKDEETQREEGGHYDNPERFQKVLVIDDEQEKLRGRFTIVAPALDEEGRLGGIRYGLENESTRLNLGALLLAEDQVGGVEAELVTALSSTVGEAEEIAEGGRGLLMALPGMTEEIADAVLDWIDEDEDDVRPYGAEAEYYSGLDPPYAPRNGIPVTIEELLLVRGVTPGLLFGLDINRNGVVDPHEEGGEIDADVDNSDGSMDRGWSAYLTLHSMERNVASDGQQRVYLNTDDMQQLYEDLAAVFPQAWATFIVAYRQNGPYSGSNPGEPAGGGSLDLTKPGSVPLVQVLDLIGKRVRVTFEGDDEPTILESPFPDGPLAMGVYLPRLMDYATITDSPTIPGRININQASRTVLLGIPGMTEEMVTEILSRRELDADEENLDRQHETWLLTEAIVTLDEMKILMPLVTAGGDVYRAQVVGYFESGDASARTEVIIDATKPTPQILFWRNLSHLGRGYPLETLGIDVVAE